MLRNGKISAPVSGSRVAKIYKGFVFFLFQNLSEFYKFSQLGNRWSHTPWENIEGHTNAMEYCLLKING